ncbi:MAG: hypothetical protein HY253_07340 [Burkholderiales bacterium]|nr:hypothetical protein [Burkholderiales bacterium]
MLLALQDGWLSCRDGVWQEHTEFPRLASGTNILTDFGNAPFGVMPVDTRPDFAAAVIEKTLRAEGLVDGEVHMLPHRIFAVGGGSRVLYTAVPLSQWQQVHAWLSTHTSIHLLFSLETAMLALAQKHDAVICRIDRQFRLLVSNSTNLVSISVNAFSDDQDDIETALNNLCDQARQQWQGRNDKMSLLWVDVLASGAELERSHLAHVAQRLHLKVEAAPCVKFGTAEQPRHSAVGALMGVLDWRNALNPALDRVAAASDRFGVPIAALTAMCGIGLLALSGWWGVQALQLQDQAQEVKQEIAKIDQSNGKMALSPDVLMQPFNPETTFLSKLGDALHGPDPLEFLNDLRQASFQRVRVMRVRLNGKDSSFRVDGVPYTDGSSEKSLSSFLGEMQKMGYQLKSEDPGVQGQQTGLFSYSISKIAPLAGAAK